MSCLTGKLAAAAVADPALRGILQDIVCALGPQGIGPQGPQGVGSTLEEGYGYRAATPGTSQTVASTATFAFSDASLAKYAGGVAPSVAGLSFVRPGRYRFDAAITTNGAAAWAWAWFRNGVVEPGSVFGVSSDSNFGNSGMVPNSGTIVLDVVAGDAFEIRNACASGVTTATVINGATINNAWMMATRLGDVP